MEKLPPAHRATVLQATRSEMVPRRGYREGEQQHQKQRQTKNGSNNNNNNNNNNEKKKDKHEIGLRKRNSTGSSTAMQGRTSTGSTTFGATAKALRFVKQLSLSSRQSTPSMRESTYGERSVPESMVAKSGKSLLRGRVKVNEYEFIKELGSGAFATVHLVQKRSGLTRQKFAVKVFNKSILSKKRDFRRVGGRTVVTNELSKVMAEVALMKKLDHPNICRLHEVIDDPSDHKLYLVLEFVKGGEVMNRVDERRYDTKMYRGGVIPETYLRTFSRQLLCGLHYLHDHGVAHRDLKPENVLVQGDGSAVKIADFGVALVEDTLEDMNHAESLDAASQRRSKLSAPSLRTAETAGTYHFLSPEACAGGAYSPFRNDIWSLGVTIFCMAVGWLPSTMTMLRSSLRKFLKTRRSGQRLAYLQDLKRSSVL